MQGVFWICSFLTRCLSPCSMPQAPAIKNDSGKSMLQVWNRQRPMDMRYIPVLPREANGPRSPGFARHLCGWWSQQRVSPSSRALTCFNPRLFMWNIHAYGVQMGKVNPLKSHGVWKLLGVLTGDSIWYIIYDIWLLPPQWNSLGGY